LNGGSQESRRSIGNDDPTLPEIRKDPTAQVLIADRLDAPERVDGSGEDTPTPFAVKMDVWRRHYLPLPDEVVHEYLGEDEYVVHTDHPSFRAFLIKNGFQVLGLGAVALMFLIFARGGFDWWTILIFLILQLILAFLALKRLSDRYTSYVITNLRLIRLSGIFGRKLASIPWTRMTGLGYRQKPMGRLLGYATIFIESANEESGLREFSDINDPAAFHQKILDMISSKSGQSTKEPPPATKGVRKSFMARRRERRALSVERAMRAYRPNAKPTPSKEPGASVGPAESAPKRDTGGVYEAFSTSDSDHEGLAPPVEPPTPPSSPSGRAAPIEPGEQPQSGTRRPPVEPGTSSTAPPTSPPAAEPRSRRPPPIEPEAAPSVDAGPTSAAVPEAPETVDDDESDSRPNWWPGRSGSKPTRPKQPPPSSRPSRLSGRVPKAERPVPPFRPGRPTRTPPPAPPTPPSAEEPPLERPANTPPPPRWAPMGRPRPTPRPDAGESARDALAALRRGQRPIARPVRRPRLPSFGRRPRPTFPESRQLPAADEDRNDTPPPDNEPQD
jgi:membrane protein YdbS with pleckstrin-like domain